MATRTISTKLAIDGESQYRESISRINGEIKSLQSALKLTESQYQNNANSMAALTAKGEALNNLYTAQATKVKELRSALENAKSAEAAYASRKEELTAKIEANNKALEELQQSTEDTSEEQARLAAENKELNAELQKNEGYLTAASKGVTSWQDKLNSAEIKLNDLDAELKLNDEYLNEARNSADGCATSIDRFGDRVKESTKDADALTNALMAAGVVAALKATADALASCVDASMDYESAMAGVAKTTDMADEELDAMGDAIQDLATRIPATATEIANVAEAAGQLGIAKEDILSFSEVMVNLGTATNLSSEEAATALAKFANVVSMSADDYERLGSTIVALGNNFATTEADIVSMATRLASTGELVGLSESEIMAVAAALSSVGIEAEAGGSAISKLLKQFEVMVQTGSPQLQDFAAVAGMSAEEFAAAWGENAVGALSLFIDGLGDVDEAGGSSVAVLEELGLTEVRLSNAVAAMASSEGVLADALDLANTAWEENTALSKEAATRYETTESKMQMLSNAADNVKIAIGDQLNPAIGELADVGIDALNWLADFIDEHEALVPLVTSAGTVIATFVTGIIAYEAAVKAAELATAAFNLIANMNPVTLAVTAVAALVAGLGVLVATLDDDAVPSVKELTTAADGLTESMEEANAAREATVESTLAAANVAETYISKLEQMEAAGIKTDEQAQQYHNTLALLCQVVPDLAQYIDLETDSIEGGTEALRANTEAWKNNALQQAYQEELTKLYEEYAAVLIEAEKNSISLTEAQYAAEAAEQKHADAIARMNELWQQAQDEANAMYEETGCLTDATAFLSDEYYELQKSLYDYDLELYNATEAAEVYQKAIDEDAEAVAAAEAEIALAEEAVAGLTAELDNNSEAAEENSVAQQEMAAKTNEVHTRINELAQAYKDAYDAAHESISGQIGLFDSFASSISEDTNTAEKMMQRWAEQTENLATYTENLEKAGRYGLDDGLVRSLSDGSAESAGYLAVIIEEIERLGGTTEGMSEDAQTFVDNFNNSFSQTEQAKEEFADVVATMETDFADAVASIEQAANDADFSGVTRAMESAFANVGVDFQSIGSDAASGFSTGIESGSGTVKSAAQGVAQASIDACRTTLDSHSDSRVMIQVGKDFVGGLVTGIEGREGELTSTVQSVGDGVVEVMTSSIKEAVDESMTEFSKISSRAKTAMNDLKSTVKDAASGFSLYGTGQELVNGMISGLNSRSSALYSTVRSIVNKAISTARSAAAVASPSKKTTEIFEFVGDGMAVGLENRREKVKETMKSVVDDSLNINVSGKIKTAMEGIDDMVPHVDLKSDPSSRSLQQKIDNHFSIAELHVREEADIDKIARKLFTMQRSNARSKGVLA